MIHYRPFSVTGNRPVGLTFCLPRQPFGFGGGKVDGGVTLHRAMGERRFGGPVLATRGLRERAMSVRLTRAAAAPLERFNGFQLAFLTMAVCLMGLGCFFSVLGGLGMCIHTLQDVS